MTEKTEAGAAGTEDMMISTLRSCGFFVRQIGLLEGQRPGVLGNIDNAFAFFKLAVAGADAAGCASQHGEAVPAKRCTPNANTERAWYKEWLSTIDGNVTVDQVEFGRRVWAERARRAAEGGDA